MDFGTILVVAVVVLALVAYIAQRMLVQSIWKKQGVRLSTGRLWPALACFGVIFLGYITLTGAWGQVMQESPWGIALFLVCVAAVLLLAVRNIKGAGVGLGILLTVLQTLSGLFIIALGAVKLGTGMATAQFTGTYPKYSERAPEYRHLNKKDYEDQMQREARERSAAQMKDAVDSATGGDA